MHYLRHRARAGLERGVSGVSRFDGVRFHRQGGGAERGHATGCRAGSNLGRAVVERDGFTVGDRTVG